MDAILFKMISRSMILIAMIVTLLFFVIKRKRVHNKPTNKEDAILKIIAAILFCIKCFFQSFWIFPATETINMKPLPVMPGIMPMEKEMTEVL